MFKFKTFIVEDEAGPLRRLRDLLEAHKDIIDISSLTTARSFKEAQNIILTGNTFDLSILDRNLGGGKTCFDLITKEYKSSFGIITITTQDEVAQKHFEEISLTGNNLVLRKPYNEDDVEVFIKELCILDRQIRNKTFFDERPFLFKDKKEEVTIQHNEIVYIEVRDNYCDIFYIKNNCLKKCNTKKQLLFFDMCLNQNYFIRISKQHLVNINYVIGKSEQDDVKLSIPTRDEVTLLPLHHSFKERFIGLFNK